MLTSEIQDLIAYVANGDYEDLPPVMLNKSLRSEREIAVDTSLFMLMEEIRGMVSREYLLHLFDASPDMQFILNSQGKILEANSAVADRLGYAPEEITDRLFSGLIDNDQILSSGHSATARFRIKEGGIFTARLIVSRLPEGSGHYGETLIIARDIRSLNSVNTVVPVTSIPLIGDISELKREILLLLAQGKTSKTIAKMLGYSPRTIEFKRQEMKKQLKAGNVANMVHRAHELGLIPVK